MVYIDMILTMPYSALLLRPHAKFEQTSSRSLCDNDVLVTSCQAFCGYETANLQGLAENKVLK